jgi:hypothetical protein
MHSALSIIIIASVVPGFVVAIDIAVTITMAVSAMISFLRTSDCYTLSSNWGKQFSYDSYM